MCQDDIMRRMKLSALFTLMVFALAGCGEGGEDPGADPPDTQESAGGMPGMEGAPGSGMMGEMMAHMESVEGISMDSMRVMLPLHRQRVANMLAQMNREMSDMNMATDAQWDATVDSIRADLTTMPEMSAEELQALMPSHRARVMRLLEMHRSMMGGPGM
jgi:hypothetical protein